MTLTLSTVKNEIRILGLDTCRKGEAQGAVVRGGGFLDGVLRFSLQANHAESKLARQARATRYYPELRVIMLHDPQNRLRPVLLERNARLPVMEVANRRSDSRAYHRFRSKTGALYFQTRLPIETAKKILSIAWTVGTLPEPARVAHLLAKIRL
jgi:endonuclease V-like protein UPF0215 family